MCSFDEIGLYVVFKTIIVPVFPIIVTNKNGALVYPNMCCLQDDYCACISDFCNGMPCKFVYFFHALFSWWAEHSLLSTPHVMCVCKVGFERIICLYRGFWFGNWHARCDGLSCNGSYSAQSSRLICPLCLLSVSQTVKRMELWKYVQHEELVSSTVVARNMLMQQNTTLIHLYSACLNGVLVWCLQADILSQVQHTSFWPTTLLKTTYNLNRHFHCKFRSLRITQTVECRVST